MNTHNHRARKAWLCVALVCFLASIYVEAARADTTVYFGQAIAAAQQTGGKTADIQPGPFKPSPGQPTATAASDAPRSGYLALDHFGTTFGARAVVRSDGVALAGPALRVTALPWMSLKTALMANTTGHAVAFAGLTLHHGQLRAEVGVEQQISTGRRIVQAAIGWRF